MKTLKERAEDYLAWESYAEFREDVQAIIHDEDELQDRFYTDLRFGTGGLRGIMGGGFNRMNPYVIMRTTEGIVRYLQQQKPEKAHTIVLCYDSRRHSRLFATVAAGVLAFHKCKVLLFSQLRPTPQLSYAVRYFSADCGIMITASHNPPRYNGYKVYWDDGAQIIAPDDEGILASIQSVVGKIVALSEQEAEQQGYLQYLGKEMDDRFLDEITGYIHQVNGGALSSQSISLAYTPLHGTGSTLMEPLFQRMHIPCYVVPSQRDPDGNFPTVKFPNPEDPAALKELIQLAEEQQTDILVATDPDADRIGIGVRHEEKIHLITGNQLGVLVADYLLSCLPRKEEKPIFINTIVTTDLQEMVIHGHGGELIQTLTGFKHIAAIIRQLETQGQLSRFIGGTEESFGLLLAPFVRDKDSITAAGVIAEMARRYAERRKTLIDRLHEIYQEHEFFREETISLVFPGEKGLATMQRVMTQLRAPTVLAQFASDHYDDYREQKTIFSDGHSKDIPTMWTSDVLRFHFKDFGWVAVRPSGTEPKLKMYFSFHMPVQNSILETESIAEESIAGMRNTFEQVLHTLAEH